MSNHFTGLRLGPPAADPRLDLTDLFAFPAPDDPARTVLILAANTFGIAEAFHPDAVYRINIDNDGDAETDIGFSVVFSAPEAGRQRATVYKATGREAREAEAVGTRIVSDAEVSFGAEPNVVRSGVYTFFAGSRSDPFVVDFGGILAAFNWKNGKNFTDLKDVKPFPWTRTDTLAAYNAFGIVLELPTSELGANPTLGIWGRASVRRNGRLEHVDRAGHPTIASFFNTDETKEEYNGADPAHDRERFMEQFAHVLGHTGDYSPEEARVAIDTEGLLPDMLSFDPTQPPGYPNGRRLTDHVVAYRLASMSKGEIPPDGLEPHTDLLGEFPFLGTPHPAPAPAN